MFITERLIWDSSWDYIWYLSHRRPAKALVSLRIHAVSPEPSLFAHMKYGSIRRVRPKIRHLAPLDGCACAFEEWVYGGRKVPWSHDKAHFGFRFLGQSRDVMHDRKRIIACYLKCILASLSNQNVFKVYPPSLATPTRTTTETNTRNINFMMFPLILLKTVKFANLADDALMMCYSPVLYTIVKYINRQYRYH